jgi:hypothetical protein
MAPHCRTHTSWCIWNILWCVPVKILHVIKNNSTVPNKRMSRKSNPAFYPMCGSHLSLLQSLRMYIHLPFMFYIHICDAVLTWDTDCPTVHGNCRFTVTTLHELCPLFELHTSYKFQSWLYVHRNTKQFYKNIFCWQGCGVGTQNLRPRLLNFYNSDSNSFIKKLQCINNGKPIRHFITTTWIIRLLFRLITYMEV